MNIQKINFNPTFNNLYHHEGLKKLDQEFLAFLKEADPKLAAQLHAARISLPDLTSESTLIIEMAPYLEDFLSHVFSIQSNVLNLQKKHQILAPLYTCKREFVRRRAQKAFKQEEIASFSGKTLKQNLETLMHCSYSEVHFSTHVLKWLQDPVKFQEHLDLALRFSAWSLLHEGESILFSLPNKIDLEHLIRVEKIEGNPPYLSFPKERRRSREDFTLTDPGVSRAQALDQAQYCIYCHHQGKDSCSKGLKDKKSDTYLSNDHKITLTGCPLEQKISEMNEVKAQGYTIGALAIIAIDNPMVAGTGHRICNDCTKACIYQKQDPVAIPSIETQILQDVLSLPFGFEIYSLLTRWNPLNFKFFLPQEASGYTVLVTGMGPAGYTLAHYLLNKGHHVVGIDGLKIQPLADESTLIKTITDLYESLDERVQAGFGGVAEYGITARWNKNYLKLIRLLLERRERFKLYGGVRLGSQLTLSQVFKLGFDHIALCMGAGSPQLLPLKNNLVKGVKQASDFLMALQLTGAAQKSSITNLQIQMPIVVIGGGLTAIDTATEAAAYYIIQVEKFAQRYKSCLFEEDILQNLPKDQQSLAVTFLKHAQLVSNEREKALRENRQPSFQNLLDQWGGVTIAYRKNLEEAPSYRLNHEEVEKAFEEGIRFLPNFHPLEVLTDSYNSAIGLKGALQGKTTTLPAKTIFIAVGTKPNTILAQEESGINLEDSYFAAMTEKRQSVTPQRLSKPDEAQVILDHQEYPGKLSFFGDLHPSFKGNVVKAMASAKRGYPIIDKLLRSQPPSGKSSELFHYLDNGLKAWIVSVQNLAPKIIEVVVKAPLAAQNFQPGQFYRLQNFAVDIPMEGLALTGASLNKEKGTLSLIVLEMGGSSNLCRFLKKGEQVVLMGPTGTPTEIPQNKNILLAGGGLGNAVLFSIGQAMRQQGCRVIYVAAYRQHQDIFKQTEIQNAAEQVIWVCEEGSLAAQRPQDLTFKGNIVQALQAYAEGKLEKISLPFKEFDRLLTIGSDRMMAAVHHAFATSLKSFANPSLVKLASINSPMQCMMKEICAQCLQRQHDPLSGEEHYVFSCAQQDQLLDHVDFQFLSDRLSQNSLSETVTAQWLKHQPPYPSYQRMK